MSIAVLKPGMLSSFQDLGRLGYQHQGIPAAGAMDARAHVLASLLAGNDPAHTASLEITLTGPTLRFDGAACFALSGASMRAALNGRAIPNHRPLLARRGDVLSFGAAAPQGLRGYLAIRGGYALPKIMGSESTYLRSGFGGYHGRALAKGDTVGLAHAIEDLDDTALDALEDALWDVRVYLPAGLGLQTRDTIRAIPGRQWDAFTASSRDGFTTRPFVVTPQSERMGYRLQGPVLAMTAARQMLSEATCFGTVQVPTDGAPIVLMADRQTTGGYPKIAQVATVDLPLLAQIPPGGTVRFEMITLEAAQKLDSSRVAAFSRLADALRPLREVYARHACIPHQEKSTGAKSTEAKAIQDAAEDSE